MYFCKLNAYTQHIFCGRLPIYEQFIKFAILMAGTGVFFIPKIIKISLPPYNYFYMERRKKGVCVYYKAQKAQNKGLCHCGVIFRHTIGKQSRIDKYVTCRIKVFICTKTFQVILPFEGSIHSSSLATIER